MRLLSVHKKVGKLTNLHMFHCPKVISFLLLNKWKLRTIDIRPDMNEAEETEKK